MKILQLNTVSRTGSVGRIILDLYQVIENNGHECMIAYGRGEAPEDTKSFKANSKIDFYFHVLNNFITGKHGFSSTYYTKKLIEYIKEYNPDIIHMHNIHGFYLDVEEFFKYLKESNKPVVWTLHDCWSFTGHCAYFDYVECDKWKKGCYECPQYKNAYPYGLLHDNSVNNYRRKKEAFSNVPNLTIVTPSEWLKNYVKQSFLKNYPVEVIYNGINLDVFKPQKGEIYNKYKESDKKIILGVANQWENRKGLKYFEELSQMLSDEYKIILVGLNNSQLKKINSCITGISRTSNVQELAQLYTLADVYVNATLEDNFPTTNLEALACGTPVITFRTGGSVESIDESCGIIVDKKDTVGLKRAIEELCNNKINEEICIKKALKYSKYDRFEEYIDLYRRIYEENSNEQ